TATINTIKKLDYGSALKIKLIVEGYEPDLFISPPNDSYMGDAEMDKLMADIYNLMYGDALFDSEKYFMGAIYAFKKNGLLHEFPLAFKPFFL
ncbi:MAG: hypothetical protein FWE82_10275, partial [Defluviitaleaceae bacterium]|nr:hypothetical protein [Defluviitaleaceae bacterium]